MSSSWSFYIGRSIPNDRVGIGQASKLQERIWKVSTGTPSYYSIHYLNWNTQAESIMCHFNAIGNKLIIKLAFYSSNNFNCYLNHIISKLRVLLHKIEIPLTSKIFLKGRYLVPRWLLRSWLNVFQLVSTGTPSYYSNHYLNWNTLF